MTNNESIETTETISKTYEVYSCNLSRLLDRVAVLNRRAAKLGCAEITVCRTSRPAWTEEVLHPVTKEVVAHRELVEVEVVGEAPKFANWVFTASVDSTSEGNLLRISPVVPEGVSLERFRTSGCVCEHCKLERNRRETFVLRNTETNELKQIGRDCLKDFLGHTNPHLLAARAELFLNVDELFVSDNDEAEYGGFRSDDDRINTVTVLNYAAWCVRNFGFVPAAAERDYDAKSTRSEVLDCMFPSRELQRIWRRDDSRPVPTDGDKAFAAAALEHARNLEGDSDFDHNVRTIAKLEAVPRKNLGLTVYLVELYRRFLADEPRRKAKVDMEARKGETKHFGELGKRVRNLTVTYLGANSFESQFGLTYIHKFDAEGGERLVWKTGSSIDANPGNKIVLEAATIKEHGEYKGWKQTKLSRVVVLIPENAPAAA